ncbi:hypothetical protein ACJX0J_005431, partial [Zea mays]
IRKATAITVQNDIMRTTLMHLNFIGYLGVFPLFLNLLRRVSNMLIIVIELNGPHIMFLHYGQSLLTLVEKIITIDRVIMLAKKISLLQEFHFSTPKEYMLACATYPTYMRNDEHRL